VRYSDSCSAKSLPSWSLFTLDLRETRKLLLKEKEIKEEWDVSIEKLCVGSIARDFGTRLCFQLD